MKKRRIPLHPKAEIEVSVAIQNLKDGRGDPEISGTIEIVFEATADFERDVIVKNILPVEYRAAGFYAFHAPVSKVAKLLDLNLEYLHRISLKKWSRPNS